MLLFYITVCKISHNTMKLLCSTMMIKSELMSQKDWSPVRRTDMLTHKGFANMSYISDGQLQLLVW